MPQNTNTLNQERTAHSTQPLPPTPVQMYEALTRLREVGEKLPPVDAVAVIRECRDLSVQESQ